MHSDAVPNCAQTRSEARRLAATYLVIEDTVRQALLVLQKAGLRPVVLKGLAVAEFYPRGGLRPTGDVDLLVHPNDLAAARSSLEAAGWSAVVSGRWAEDYLQREGYCWQAARPGEAVLEVHYRLWGSVAPEFAVAAFEASVEALDLRRPCTEDLIVMAASHAWRQASPRRGADFLDVALVLENASDLDYDRLLHRVELSAQHLPVALCLRALGDSVPEPARHWLAAQLVPLLRGRERRLYRTTRETDPDGIPWSQIRLAMLLAGRPSRLGWKAVWRRFWPHPVTRPKGLLGLPARTARLLHALRRRG